MITHLPEPHLLSLPHSPGPSFVVHAAPVSKQFAHTAPNSPVLQSAANTENDIMRNNIVGVRNNVNAKRHRATLMPVLEYHLICPGFA